MREIKVTVFLGNIGQLTDSNFQNPVQENAFQRANGMAVQQFAYQCALQRDSAGTVLGRPENVVFDFTVCVMQAEQNIFYEKLMEKATERFTFIFNAKFENDKLKDFDNAIMAEGYIVNIEEYGSNDNEQAMMRVKLLASELTYLHKNNDKLILTISK